MPTEAANRRILNAGLQYNGESNMTQAGSKGSPQHLRELSMAELIRINEALPLKLE